MRRRRVPRRCIDSHFGPDRAAADFQPRCRRTPPELPPWMPPSMSPRTSLLSSRRAAEIRLQGRERAAQSLLLNQVDDLLPRVSLPSNPRIARASPSIASRRPTSLSPNVPRATPSRSLRVVDRSNTELQPRLGRREVLIRDRLGVPVLAQPIEKCAPDRDGGRQKAEGKIKGLLRVPRN
jgi:hypothetical protein